MARGAAQFREDPLTRSREGATAAAAHPCFELRRLLHDDIADHSRVLRAAILRAEEVICSRLDGAEPQHRVPAWEHVLLHTEGRDVETMDHVLRSHDQFDIASHGNV